MIRGLCKITIEAMDKSYSSKIIKAIFSSKMLLMAILAGCIVFNNSSFAQSSPQTYTTPGSYSFTVPSCVTSINVEVVGGGGNGGGNGGNGGSGGGYSSGTFSVTPGTAYTVNVGAAGGTTNVGALISATGGGSNGGAAGSGSGGSVNRTGGLGGSGTSTYFGGGGGGWSGGGGMSGGGGASGSW